MAQGKKFAAEFALRRNVSALDKILIQDSDDDVVKYAYPPQIASLSGYAYANSIQELPTIPKNKAIGYIVGQMLYIYVGEGGDTRNGLYQSVGFFVGPQGVQGEKGEQGERGEQGIQGPKGDNGGFSTEELNKFLEGKKYITEDALTDILADYVSNTSLMRDYLTIAQTQDVTGVKNFKAGVQFDGLPMYKSKEDTIFLDANLVLRGSLTMFGVNTTTSPSIFANIPIDGKTIGRNEQGELYVIGGTGGGGGVVDSVAWSNITDKPEWVGADKPSYSYSEITDTPDLGGFVTAESLTELLSGKADKGTKLADYGITDAYTKDELGAEFKMYMLKDTAQRITAQHDFTKGLLIDGLAIRKSADKTFYFDGNLVVSGAMTMFGKDSTTFPTIWANIPFNPEHMSWDGSYWNIEGGGGGASVTKESVIEALGYTPLSTNGGTINGNGRNLLTVNTSDSYGPMLQLHVNNAVKAAFGVIPKSTGNENGTFISNVDASTAFVLGNDGKPYFATDSSNLSPKFELLHANNVSKYALPITGGIMTAGVDVIGFGRKDVGIGGSSTTLYLLGNSIQRRGTDASYHDILDADNYSKYALPITGGIIEGNIQVRGNQVVDGNVAIGGATADEKLHVHGNVKATGAILSGASRNLLSLYTSDTYGPQIKLYENEKQIASIGCIPKNTGAQYGLFLSNTSSNFGLLLGNDGKAYLTNDTSNLTKTYEIIHSGNYSDLLAGGTINGSFRINKFLAVGAATSQSNTARAQINLVSSGANPCDLYFGADDTLYWSVTARHANDYTSKAFALYDVINSAFRMIMFPNGNLALGGTAASEKLHVYGNVLTTGTITMFSQASLKNIINREGLSLDELAQIRPARFTWKDGRDERVHVGVIAENILPILPEVVYSTGEEKTKTVDYASLATHIGVSLIQPVVNLAERVKKLEAEVKALKQENNKLKQLIA